MRRQPLIWILGLAGVTGPAAAFAHTPYVKALKERHELRSVSCFACHAKGKDEETGRPLGKEHLNALGESLHAMLKDKKITERIEAAKQLSIAERKAVNEEAAAEFLKAMEQIESKPSADGKTWLQLIQTGELEGIRLKEQ